MDVIIFKQSEKSHNPYFNRWFSAIGVAAEKIWGEWSHNPYFNRWFSAITCRNIFKRYGMGHNPYFNRWFSAIFNCPLSSKKEEVTILILIDGFLQSVIILSKLV